jgi:hypothetical protein
VVSFRADPPVRRPRRFHCGTERHRAGRSDHPKDYGIDRPLPIQFIDWAARAALRGACTQRSISISR